MISTHKNLYSYIETAIITIIYIGVGIYFYPNDPLFIHTTIPFLTILFIIVTLFYGLKRGFLSLVLVSIVLYIYYRESYISQILVYFLLILILGQFYHYWYNRYRKSQKEFSYVSERLEELSNAFFTLKISHDTLEKSYALKPHSLRSSIKMLEKLYFEDGSHYENFLHLIAQSFHVQGSIIALLQDDNSYKTVASVEGKKELDLNDPLVEKVFQMLETSYVDGYEQNESSYLIVIPVKNQKHQIVALLAIDEMPFLDFNQNNIISIAIVFSYFIDQVNLWGYLEKHGASSVSDRALFSYRYRTMAKLNREYGTNSCVLIFKAKDELLYQQLLDILNSSIRTLDMLQTLERGENFIIKVLLPFNSKESVSEMVAKIINNPLLANKKVPYMIFNISQKKLIEQYIEEKI